MRFITIALLMLSLAAPTMASEGGKKSSKKKSNRIKAEWTVKNDVFPEYKIPDQAQSTHSVDIPVVVAPISIDGRLVNYAFLAIRVVLHDKINPWKMRTKSYFMRDAVVRKSHEYTFGKAGETSTLDEERAIKLVREAILPWIPSDQIDHIEFLSIDMLNG